MPYLFWTMLHFSDSATLLKIYKKNYKSSQKKKKKKRKKKLSYTKYCNSYLAPKLTHPTRFPVIRENGKDYVLWLSCHTLKIQLYILNISQL